MLFNTLRIYSVHLKPDEDDEIERLKFISEGFNFYAFIFTFFWALYNRLWKFSALLLMINGFAAALLWQFDVLFPPTTNIIQIGLQLWCGWVANDFLCEKLKKDGYITYALVSGENELRAEQRFFDHNIQHLNA